MEIKQWSPNYPIGQTEITRVMRKHSEVKKKNV